jgi:hypothetical protein
VGGSIGPSGSGTDPTDYRLSMGLPGAEPPVTIRATQVLELGTPDSDMMLSFDCSVYLVNTGIGTLSVELNGEVIVPWFQLPSNTKRFSFLITDPALRNLDHPVFAFAFSNYSVLNSSVLIDNVVLMGVVPEPGSGAAALAGLGLAITRRTRWGQRKSGGRGSPPFRGGERRAKDMQSGLARRFW